MFKYRTPRNLLLVLAPMAVVLMTACGGGDDDSAAAGSTSAGTGGEQTSAQSNGPVEMVPLSSLDLDLPFEMSYDPPVPSDATVNRAIEREATAGTHAGYDLTLDTSASYEDMQAAYDEYVATFEFSQPFPDSKAWSGRRAEGEPSITIAVIGGRLNIAEILDN